MATQRILAQLGQPPLQVPVVVPGEETEKKKKGGGSSDVGRGGAGVGLAESQPLDLAFGLAE